MTNTIIGYGGTILLLLAYASLLTRWSKYFIPIDIVASFILTIHAVLLKDLPFIIVNGLVTVMLTVKFLKKETI